MMTIAWISLGLDLELDGAHVPESHALDEEHNGQQRVVSPGVSVALPLIELIVLQQQLVNCSRLSKEQ